MNRRQISFGDHISVEHGYCVIPSPDENLRSYPDIYDRICSIIYLATKIQGKPDRCIISPKALSETMIRSSLCEFISLEDYIKVTYQDIDESNYKIYKSSDPILHMLKLLRNYNIHISTSEHSSKIMSVMFPNFPEEIMEISVPYISNISIDTMRSIRDAKYYSNEIMGKMIECFEFEQHKYGVDTLIIKAALHYSAQLLQNLKLTKEINC